MYNISKAQRLMEQFSHLFNEEEEDKRSALQKTGKVVKSIAGAATVGALVAHIAHPKLRQHLKNAAHDFLAEHPINPDRLHNKMANIGRKAGEIVQGE